MMQSGWFDGIEFCKIVLVQLIIDLRVAILSTFYIKLYRINPYSALIIS